MLRFAVFPLLLVSLFVSGCLAFTAGAVGGAVADSDDADSVTQYVNTHDVSNRVAKAMYEGRVVEDMTKEEVRLVLGERPYSCEPTAQTDTSTTWMCDRDDPKWIDEYTIEFQSGEVVHSTLPAP